MHTGVLVRKSDGKRSLGRPRCRWEDNNGIVLKSVGGGDRFDLSGSGYRKIAGSCGRGNVPSSYIKCGEFD